MKSLRIFAVLTLLMGIFCASSAMAAEIVVVNGTGFTIQALGLADSNSSGNAQDLLGSDTLANGEGLRINISGSSNGWELIAQDDSGNQVNWQNLDLTGVKKITLKADGTANFE